MVSYSTQNYSSLKKSTWPHLLLVGQLGQTWSNLLKTCIIWYGSLHVDMVKEFYSNMVGMKEKTV